MLTIQTAASRASPLRLLAAPTKGIGEVGTDTWPVVADAKPVEGTDRTVPLTTGSGKGLGVGVTVVLPITMTGADTEGSTMLELAAGVAVARADSCKCGCQPRETELRTT